MKVCLLIPLLVGLLTAGLKGLNVSEMARNCAKISDTAQHICLGWEQLESPPSDPCNQTPSPARCTHAFASVSKQTGEEFLVRLAGKSLNADGYSSWVGMMFYDSRKVWKSNNESLQIRFGVACVSEAVVFPQIQFLFGSFGKSTPYYVVGTGGTLKSESYISDRVVDLEPGWMVCQFKLNVLDAFRVKRTNSNRRDAHKVALVGNSAAGSTLVNNRLLVESPEYITSSSYALDFFKPSASASEAQRQRRGYKFLILLLLGLVMQNS